MIACQKITFATHREAHEHQRAIKKRNGSSTKTYRCPECGGLHIYTITKNKKMRKHK